MEWFVVAHQSLFLHWWPTLIQITLFSGTITSVSTGRTLLPVKNMIFQHVKSKKCVINGAKDFAEYANKIINGISCLYLAENEIMAEPQDIETSPKIKRTLKVHKVLRTYNEDNVCKIEFYKLADETDPFHIQWYRKEGDQEVFVGTISFH